MVKGNPTCVRRTPPVPPPKCLTCADLPCKNIGLVCVSVPNKCINPRVPCCVNHPICVSVNTIAGSTVATTASTVATGTTRGAGVTTSALTGTTRGATGSSFDSSAAEGSSLEGLVCGADFCELGEVCNTNVLPPRCESVCNSVNCPAGTTCYLANGIPACR